MTTSLDSLVLRTLVRCATICCRRAWWVALLSVALTVASLAYTAGNLGVNTDTTDVISEDVPYRRNHEAFVRAFPELQDPIVAVIDSAGPEAADRAAIALADALGRRSDLFLGVDVPAANPFFRRNGLLYLDVDALDATATRLAAAAPMLASLRADPSLRGILDLLVLAVDQRPGGDAADLTGFVNRIAAVAEAQARGVRRELSWRAAFGGERSDGPARALVFARPVLDHATLAPAAAPVAAIGEAAAQLGIGAGQGLRLRLTGPPVLELEELSVAMRGAAQASVASILLVSVLLIWGLRSARLIVATLLTLGAGLVWTAALATLTVGNLNLISVTFAVLFVGLGVDFGIHFSLRYREAAGKGSHLEALSDTASGVGSSLCLSALCAALGFLSFVPTDYRGLAELGIISAGGMAVAAAASLTLLPALLTILPGRPFQGMSVPTPGRGIRPLVERGAPAILVVALAAGVVSAAAIPLVRFDFNPVNLNAQDNPSVKTFRDLADNPGTTPYVVEALASGIDDAMAITAELEALEEVETVMSLAGLVPDEQDTKLAIIDEMALYLAPLLGPPPEGAPPGPAELRETRDSFVERMRALPDAVRAGALGRALTGLAQTLSGLGRDETALAELDRRLTVYLPDLFADLDAAMEAAPVTLDNLPDDLRARWESPAGAWRLVAFPAEPVMDNAELRRLAESVLAVVPHATGLPILILEGGRAVVAAFEEATILALVVIAALLAFLLRRVEDVALALAPLLLAALLLGASTVLLGLSFNFANVIVLPLLLGLGVSSAIHLVIRRRDSHGDDLLRTSTPRAVLFSALTTIASFGSLALSPHPGMASMGLLLTIAIFWTLVATLVVLPAMIAMLDRRRTRKRS